MTNNAVDLWLTGILISKRNADRVGVHAQSHVPIFRSSEAFVVINY